MILSIVLATLIIPFETIAIPLLLQSYGIFVITYGLAWVFRIRHEVAAPAAMIGTSNFFELAVAVAISLFGLHSGAALATVVGVLIEVPVMLVAVRVVNQSQGWYERRNGIVPYEECCPSDVHMQPHL